MFTSTERQRQRTGKYGTSRFDYLQELVTEFQTTTKEESKLSIVAHLANFAYDPFNYEFFRKLHIIDLFLDCLTEPCEKMVEYGIAGICNCCPDPANAEIVAKSEAIPLIAACLSNHSEKIVLCAVTTLYYLCTPAVKAEVLGVPSIIEQIKDFANRETTACVQLKHTAQAFLDKLTMVSVD